MVTCMQTIQTKNSTDAERGSITNVRTSSETIRNNRERVNIKQFNERILGRKRVKNWKNSREQSAYDVPIDKKNDAMD